MASNSLLTFLLPLLVLCVFFTRSCLAAQLHHLAVTRRPVPASRLFHLAQRPWYAHYLRHIPANVSSPFLDAAATLSRAQNYASPIHGSITPMGEYYVTLSFCGQHINVQIDTGSSTMAVPLKQCTNCLATSRRLDLSKSCGRSSGVIPCSSSECGAGTCRSTCAPCNTPSSACCSKEMKDGCGFHLLYADQSGVTGALVRAQVGISTITTPLVFGGILTQKSFQAKNVDGIFGLAYKTLACNPTCVTPLLDTLVENGQVKHDIFSLCTGSEGGVLTLGGSNPALYHGSLSYVPLSNSFQNLFYKVDISRVTVGGAQVHIPSFTNGIIDSGTTLLIMSTTSYNALKSFFQSNYCHVPGLCLKSTSRRVAEIIAHPYYPHSDIDGRAPSGLNVSARQSVQQVGGAASARQHTWFEPGYCVALNANEMALLPEITIHLNGFDFVLPSKIYMIPHYVDRGVTRRLYHCLGIAPLNGMEYMPNDAIIGDTVLQKYYVEYDRENSRLGFALAKSCVDPTAREPGSSSSSSSSASSSTSFLDLIYAVPTVIWYIIVLGLALVLASRFLRRSGYEPIES